MLVRRLSSGLVFSDGDGNYNTMPGPSFLSRNIVAIYDYVMQEQAREEAKWAGHKCKYVVEAVLYVML